MSYKIEWIILTFLLSLYSCNSKNPDISEQIKDLRNKTINLDECITDTLQTAKILILIPDTGNF